MAVTARERTEMQTMAEYIEREALKNDIAKSTEPFNTGSVFRAINRQIAADVAPIEALEHLRDELCAQDLITMEGLRKLNTLIWKYTTAHDGRG